MAVRYGLKWVGAVVVMAAGLGVATLRGADDAAPAAATLPAAIPVTMEGRAEVMGLPAAPNIPASVEDLQRIQKRVEAVVKEALPATVAIIMQGAQGSGVIVSRDGYVLTAGHVSGKPGTSIRIRLTDGREVKAKSLGANNTIDSGMVKITDPGDYPFVPVGTAKNLTAGQWVVAMGHPGGFQLGRPPVVRLGRVLLANRNYIGTDSTLISGDSGGPVFDLDGKLIGINSRIGQTTTSNMHVPIDTFVETWDRLAKGDEWGGMRGLFDRPGGRPAAALGLRGFDDEKGVRVGRVHPGTGADKAKVLEGDIITRFNGRLMKSPDDLAAAVRKRRIGERVSLEILRDGKTVDVTVTLGVAGM